MDPCGTPVEQVESTRAKITKRNCESPVFKIRSEPLICSVRQTYQVMVVSSKAELRSSRTNTERFLGSVVILHN